MKVAPVLRSLAARPDAFEQILVHTGQHYDPALSEVFLEELAIATPDYTLTAGSGSHAQQTARVMERLEPVVLEVEPDLVLVAGDVNPTLAAALVAAKIGVPVGHVEAGLRSFDRSMPEEVNRVLVDAISDLLFIHSPEARTNLVAEGRAEHKIHDVGNTMIDTLVAMRPQIDACDAPSAHGLEIGGYLLVTLHRPALVDGPLLRVAMDALAKVTDELKVAFPVHPRTKAAMEALNIRIETPGLRLLEPMGYVEFLSLLAGAAGALTDSGGIQEETTFLGVPCFTLRDNTERPITVDMGTNTLLGLRPDRITEIPSLVEQKRRAGARVPLPGWDGTAANRIADVLASERPFWASLSQGSDLLDPT
jgi:UDP-N-acetylglucosamine 2-epimerase (non-hydrolysing)